MPIPKIKLLPLCAALLGATACAHHEPAHARNPSTRRENMMTVRDSDGNVHSQPVAARDAMGRQDPEHSALSDGKGVGVYNPEQHVDTGNHANAGQSSGSAPMAGAQGANSNASACVDAIHFDSDSSRLPQSSYQALDRLADCLKRQQVDHATIVGQTDPTGSARHNEQLGIERARVVAEYLRGRGVPESQIRVSSRGEAGASSERQLWPAERNASVQVTR